MGGKNNDGEAVAAATEQGKQDRITADQATWADRMDQNNPFGSIQYSNEQVNKYANAPMPVAPSPPPSVDGGGDSSSMYQAQLDQHNKDMDAYRSQQAEGERTKWTQDYVLSDQMQGFLDQDMGNIGTAKEMQTNALNQAQKDMANPFDMEQFGSFQDLNYNGDQWRQTAEDAAYQRQANRLNPRFEQERSQLENTLRNRGLREGDAAFDTALQNFNMSKNDAFEQARLGSTAEGRAEFGQGFNQAVTANDMANALRQKRIDEGLASRYRSAEEAAMLDTTDKLGAIQDVYSATGG